MSFTKCNCTRNLINTWAKDAGVWISDDDIDKLVRLVEEKFTTSKADEVYEYSKRLAIWIWDKWYKSDSSQFEVLSDTIGVLTQIDNMLVALARNHQSVISLDRVRAVLEEKIDPDVLPSVDYLMECMEAGE